MITTPITADEAYAAFDSNQGYTRIDFTPYDADEYDRGLGTELGRVVIGNRSCWLVLDRSDTEEDARTEFDERVRN